LVVKYKLLEARGTMASKIAITDNGKVNIPADVLNRSGLGTGTEVVVETFDGGLMLLRAALDARRLYLEPTSRCNLNCKTCMRNSWQETLGSMPLEAYREILAQLRSFSAMETIHFCGFGEPLSHGDIFEMLRLAHEHGLRTELTTNGLLLERGVAQEIIDSGVHTVVVSVDGVQPETYGDIRGADLERVIQNVAGLANLKRERGVTLPRIGLEFVAMKRNIREIPQLLRLAVSLGASFVLVTNLMPYTEDLKDEILYGNGSRKWPVTLWWFWRWGSSRIILPKMQIRTERYCRFVEGASMTVAWDGGVSACYPLMHSYPCFVLGRRKEMYRHTFGNALEEGLATIWTSPDYVRFRARVKRFDFPSCTDCSANDACHFVQTNEADCWGNSPSCGDCLWARGLILCL